MMEKIIPIKDLRPGMKVDCIQGTVMEVSPEVNTPTEPGQKHRRSASFVLQDDSGRIRVVCLGNFCYIMDAGRITVGRQVKISLFRVKKGQDGQPEIVVQHHYTRVEALPTPEEEEFLRRLQNEGPIMPTRWITRDNNPELYQKVPVTIQVPRGMLEFAKFLAAQEGVPVEELLARKLDTELEWEFYPPNQ